MHDLKNIIESLLFVTEEPLTLEKLRGILETVDTKEIRAALQNLADEYDKRGGGFLLREVAGGWQMRSRPEFYEWIKRMLQPSPQRLSKAALETLALIAYKQPIIRADIEHVRGVDCGGVLRQLMERKLIRVLGRREIAGRPLIYATTKLFLEMFDLKDLRDLPTPREIAEFGHQPGGTAEEAKVADPDQMPTSANEISESKITSEFETVPSPPPGITGSAVDSDEVAEHIEPENAEADHTTDFSSAAEMVIEEEETAATAAHEPDNGQDKDRKPQSAATKSKVEDTADSLPASGHRSWSDNSGDSPKNS